MSRTAGSGLLRLDTGRCRRPAPARLLGSRSSPPLVRRAKIPPAVPTELTVLRQTGVRVLRQPPRTATADRHRLRGETWHAAFARKEAVIVGIHILEFVLIRKVVAAVHGAVHCNASSSSVTTAPRANAHRSVRLSRSLKVSP